MGLNFKQKLTKGRNEALNRLVSSNNFLYDAALLRIPLGFMHHTY